MSNVTPVVGMGATMVYVQDTYGYVITEVSESGKTIKIQRLATVDTSTGHKPAYYEGPFPVWSHDYTPDEMEAMREGVTEVARLTKRGWSARGTLVQIGTAHYHRNYSY